MDFLWKDVLILLVRAVTVMFFFLILKEGEAQALLQRAYISHTLSVFNLIVLNRLLFVMWEIFLS